MSLFECGVVSALSLVSGAVQDSLAFVLFNLGKFTFEVHDLLLEVVALLLESLDNDVVLQIVSRGVFGFVFSVSEFSL